MKKWFLIHFILVILPIALIFLKVFKYDYSVFDVVPEKGYEIKLDISTNILSSRPINLETFVAPSNQKQRIFHEQSLSQDFKFSSYADGENKKVNWSAERIQGIQKVRYLIKVRSEHVQYEFSPDTILKLRKAYPEQMQKYLGSTDLIQVKSPLIMAKTEQITKGRKTIYDKIFAIHEFIVDGLKYENFSGGLDAVAALQLAEASCNGKSRLYVAMVRGLGIPSRVVGGIILNRSPKKVTHQWLEIYLNGIWVPFDPTNGYFAELPKNYITLYYGDKVLFKHSSRIDFDYQFSYRTIMIPKDGLDVKFGSLPFNIFGVMKNFEQLDMSLNILIYLLMLPLAAVISVLLRNIIGLDTFGTFLPILIASAMQSTGLGMGIAVFFGVIFVVAIVNAFVSKLDLLYHPKMAVILSSVIFMIIFVFFVSVEFKLYDLINIIYFPVAIIAITVNRVYHLLEEDGVLKVALISLNTAVVTALCFYFINSTFLQLLMLSFPELILVFAAINLMMGRWCGLRLSEYIRFSGLFSLDPHGKSDSVSPIVNRSE